MPIAPNPSPNPYPLHPITPTSISPVLHTQLSVSSPPPPAPPALSAVDLLDASTQLSLVASMRELGVAGPGQPLRSAAEESASRSGRGPQGGDVNGNGDDDGKEEGDSRCGDGRRWAGGQGKQGPEAGTAQEPLGEDRGPAVKYTDNSHQCRSPRNVAGVVEATARERRGGRSVRFSSPEIESLGGCDDNEVSRSWSSRFRDWTLQ